MTANLSCITGNDLLHMDDIVDRIRQDLERVKAREGEVLKQEDALKAEIATAKAKNSALDESRIE